jgi:hypothetical protein
VQIASDPLNDLKVPAVGLKPKFHWELSNNSRLFSATAFQGRFSNCHFFPSWTAVTAVRFLVQETVSSYSFHAAKASVFRWFFDFIGVLKIIGSEHMARRITRSRPDRAETLLSITAKAPPSLFQRHGQRPSPETHMQRHDPHFHCYGSVVQSPALEAFLSGLSETPVMLLIRPADRYQGSELRFRLCFHDWLWYLLQLGK